MSVGNSGQSWQCASRLLVPAHLRDWIAEQAAEDLPPVTANSRRKLGRSSVSAVAEDSDPDSSGIDEGAQLICGGTGKPEQLDTGYYVKPTILPM